MNEHHHTAQLDGQNLQLQAKLSFFLRKKGKEKSFAQASAQLQHIGTPTSDVPTIMSNISMEILKHTQQ